ncbi:NACHT domain-containing protein [Frankia sp. R43]|uniref:NACHT domain-containing protein n=1 Tax=Frankia sp. R43 TaxID=269536 RepID=UPI000A4D3AE6|nr:NACHT domain-containing protein [Frankia sp. R43]
MGRALLGVGVLVLGLAVTLLAVAARGDSAVFDRWVGWASLLGLPLGALSLALGLFEKARVRAGDLDIEGAVGALRARIRGQWGEEAVLRQVDPVPLRVDWVTDGELSAAREIVLGDRDAPDWQSSPLSGDVEGIVEAFRGLRHHQLVVIGEPGAGKTTAAMVLTLGLLGLPDPGEPLAVLLPVASWNPTDEPLDAFLARRLVEEYRADLRAHGPHPADVAKRLVESSHVLPVLDGLDELPGHWHGPALEAINRFAAAGQPFVLTCRRRVYDRAVRDLDQPLARAAVILLEPVSADQVISYLSRSVLDSDRWEPVFENLRQHPDGPLAAALSSPLLVTLARTAYQRSDTAPPELLELADREAVVTRLVDGFIASVYDVHGVPGGRHPQRARPRTGARRTRRIRPERAARWLSCLACHLDRLGTRDLWWWQLGPAFTSSATENRKSWRESPAAVIFPGAAAGVTVALARDELAGFAAGLLIALLVLCLQSARVLVPEHADGGSGARPARPAHAVHYLPAHPLTADELKGRLVFGVLVGALVGVALGGVHRAVLAGILSELVFLVLPRSSVPSWRRRPSPRATMRATWMAGATAAVEHGVTGGAIFAAAAAIFPEGAGPALSGGAAAAVFAALAGADAGLGRWVRFRSAHLRLAARGWLPWRLWAFLEDAHSRGVLRQAGTVYQFRHAVLQDHLARAVLLGRERQRAGDDNGYRSRNLVALLAEQGRTDELRQRSEAGDRYATVALATALLARGETESAGALLRSLAVDSTDFPGRRLDVPAVALNALAARGEIDELRALADTGSRSAAQLLADLLAKCGRLDDLRTRAQAGDWYATARLSDILDRRGETGQAVDLLRPHAEAGDWRAAIRLVDIWTRQGRADDALALLRSRPNSPEWPNTVRLARLLAEHGDVHEALRMLRARPARPIFGLASGGVELIDILAEHGMEWELRALALPHRNRRGGGPRPDPYAALRLANLFVARGETDEAIRMLTDVADRGVERARQRLAELLLAEERADDLRRQADKGDQPAAEALARLLARRGEAGELRALAQGGSAPAGLRLADLLAEQGDLDGAVELLRGLTNYGYAPAVGSLASTLVARGDIDEAVLLLRAHDRDVRCSIALADLLADHGRHDELRARAVAERVGARRAHARLLAGAGEIDQLRAWADLGDEAAAEHLADVLADRGHVNELHERANRGNGSAARRLAALLAADGEITRAADILRPHAEAGDADAQRQLGELIPEGA